VISIIAALDDPNLFAQAFEPAATWSTWRVFLKATFGLAMTAAERDLFQLYSGRETPPRVQAREAWVVVGRRGGKSRVAALVAVYLAAFRDYRPHLAPGERATVAVIAADRRQARTVLRYMLGLLQRVPMLNALVERSTAEAIDLTNRVSIEIHTCSYRATRGYTLAAVVCDEVAFWRDELAANPDTEVIAALRPGLATIPGALLVAISSPYARKGELWNAYAKHFGQEGDPVLVWQADTRAMNETVPAHVIAEAYDADPERAAAEYGASFRTDIESFLSREAIEAAVDVGVEELPPSARYAYKAFVDPSGGASDSFTLAIAHLERQGPYVTGVLDCVREARPPFNPDEVVNDFAEQLRRYGVSTVVGDRYAGEWVRQAFRREKIAMKHSDLTKSQLYAEVLAHFNSGAVRLLDHARLVAQLAGLERRVARGGRDSVDHPPGGRDDVANAAAGALWMVLRRPTPDQVQVTRW
jgi:hypothetical protein